MAWINETNIKGPKGDPGTTDWDGITNKPDTFPPDNTAVKKVGDTMTGALIVPPGAAATTSVNFGTAGTGLHGDASNVRIAAAGINRVTIGTAITTAIATRSTSGTAATPGYSWASDTDAGFYLSAAGDMRLAMAGLDVVKWLDDKTTTFSGPIVAAASTTAGPSLTIPTGAAPTSPVNGDIWVASNALLVRLSNTSQTVMTLNATQTVSGVKTFTAKPVMTTPTTATASINLPAGVAPTTPVNGDLWTTTLGLYGRINGATVGPFIDAASVPPLNWTAITGKPSTFPPDPHVHPTSEITGLDTALTGKANVAGQVFTGKVTTPPSATGGAGLVIGLGAAPSAPVDGEVWITTGGTAQFRAPSGTTQTLVLTGGAQTITGIKTFTGKPIMTTPTTSTASINLPHGVAPTTPINGDLWTETTGVYARVNGVSVGPFGAAGGAGISDAPNDGQTYGRKSLGWIALAGGGGVAEAPTDGKLYARSNAAWNDLTDDFALKADTTALTGYAPLAGATFTGKINVPAAVTGGAGLNVGSGITAPTTLVDGDIWVTTGGSLGWRGNAVTQYAANLGSTQTITGAKTFSSSANTITGKLTISASTTLTRFAITPGAVPTAPADGDFWTTTAGLFGRFGGATVGPYIDAAAGLTWGSITGKPATFPPDAHVHPTSEVTGLDTALAGKAPTVHTHTTSDITGLDTALTGKAPTVHTHVTADVTGLDTALGLLAPKASPVFTGQITMPAGTAALPGIIITGSTNTGIYGSSTQVVTSVGGAFKLNVTATTLTFATSFSVVMPASTTTRTGLRVTPGVAPTTPTNGDMWTTAAGGFLAQLNSATRTIATDLDLAGKSSVGHTHGQADVTNLIGDLALKAPLESPALTGAPTAPTPAPADNSTAIATTGFVAGSLAAIGAATADRRNRIVNPAMQISVENGDTAGTVNAFYPADQWVAGFAGPAVSVARSSSVVPASGNRRIGGTITTGKASLAATDHFMVFQLIEGQRMSDFLWGTADAKPIVIRFWAMAGNANSVGAYTLSIRNGASDRSFLAPFTLDTAGVWKLITIPVPGDTTSVWATDNTKGMQVTLCYASGTTYQGVAGWQAGNKIAIAGSTNGVAATNNAFYFGDMGLYLDPNNTGAAPPWETPDVAEQLALCQRYFYITGSTNISQWVGAVGGYIYYTHPHPTSMRSPPAVSVQTAGTAVNISVTIIDKMSTISIGRIGGNSAAIGMTSIDSRYFECNARM